MGMPRQSPSAQYTRRPLDALVATIALVLLVPVMAIAAVGILLTDPGPVFYRARRAGRGGREFEMLKFRSMRAGLSGSGPVITATGDGRISKFGRLLRMTKIDELPQLLNVLRGDMSIVGPRPEDPSIVSRWYTRADWETLDCPPGLSSPGSIYQYTHGDPLLDAADPEGAYLRDLMPIKLALDRVYVRRRSLSYDCLIVARTMVVLLGRIVGRRCFPEPPEMAAARQLLAADPPRQPVADQEPPAGESRGSRPH